MKILNYPSSNFTSKKFRKIKYIIIHYTGMKTSAVSLKRLCDKKSEVSCHYFINEKGAVMQLVDDVNVAWHAGVSRWENDKNLNKNSLGIELQNKGEDFGYHKFSDQQIQSLIDILLILKEKYSIKDCYILAHSDIASNRKTDPGYLFPWHKLYKNNIGLLSTLKNDKKLLIKNNDIKRVQKLLSNYGYKIELSGIFDLQTILILNSFQAHFLQKKIKQFDYDYSIIEALNSLIKEKNRCLTMKI